MIVDSVFDEFEFSPIPDRNNVAFVIGESRLLDSYFDASSLKRNTERVNSDLHCACSE